MMLKGRWNVDRYGNHQHLNNCAIACSALKLGYDGEFLPPATGTPHSGAEE
jgi:hypothetical protein